MARGRDSRENLSLVSTAIVLGPGVAELPLDCC
jgi:hypothetical protein